MPDPTISSPRRIFIVPYRGRPTQKQMFLEQMKNIILAEEPPDYEIYFAQQCDLRPFNRGAMKNIGFLAMKQKYPLTYKTITFIFHDVDTWPKEKGLIDYQTTPGIVRHFYGFIYALGGMFAIKGADFELTKGFPNFWGWGLEDNVLNERCLKAGLKIDRSQFYPVKNEKIRRAFDGFIRTISKRDSVVYKLETPDDFTHLKNLNWAIKDEFINISKFDCQMDPKEQVYKSYDIRQGNKIKLPQGFNRRVWAMSNMRGATS
jgi:hypothetical protein